MDKLTRRDVIRGTAAAGLAGVLASDAVLGALENGGKTAVNLKGKWTYQSYRPEPVSIAADPKNPPTFVHWSPPGKGLVTIDEGGTTGMLEFTGTPIKLVLKIQVTEGSPARVSISAGMDLRDGKQFTNELQGWLVPAKLGEDGKDSPLVVRGSIVQTSADHPIVPKPQPIFTTGFFILEPMK